MVQLTLPKNSKIGEGKTWHKSSGVPFTRAFRIYRYSPEEGGNPRWDTYHVDMDKCGPMVLDVLLYIKNKIDPTLAFRRSCREGVCGSCAMNIGGHNAIACTKGWDEIAGKTITIAPLPACGARSDSGPDQFLRPARLCAALPENRYARP